MSTAGKHARGARLGGRAALLLGSTVVGLGLVVLGFQLFYRPRTVPAGWRAVVKLDQRHELGLRGHPIQYESDDEVVVLVGDSQVVAQGCAHERMPARRLQHHLRDAGRKARVISLGASGWGQGQQLLVLREYLARYRADAVVLWFTPSNDVWNNVFPTAWPRNGYPKPTFWLEDGTLHGPNVPMGARVPRPRSPLRILQWLERLEDRDPDGTWAMRYLPGAYEPLTEFDGTANTSWQTPANALEDLALEKTHHQLRLVPPSPRTRYGLELTRQLTRRIAETASEAGAGFLAFWAELDASSRGETVYELNGRYYRASSLQEAKSVESIMVGLDAMPVRVTTPSPNLGRDDPHLNERAVDQVMRDLSTHVPTASPPPARKPGD